MRKLNVHAGWENDAIIGTVYIEEIRGKEKFSFEYESEWLMQHENLVLDPDILNRTGLQAVPYPKEIFGFLSDITPNRWGRKLIQRYFAETENTNGNQPSPRKRVLESDYICGVSDFTRQGGIRLSENGHFLSQEEQVPPIEPSAPPVTKLKELENAAAMLERHDENVKKWLKQLINPGSSLGGARPKANVQNTDGSLWIAKFPSKNDDIDVGAWEMVVHDLAKMCGLNVPDAALLKLSGESNEFSLYGSTFMVKRFDRGENGARIHFMSAMTMLSQTDNSDDLSSYLDIADKIDRQRGSHYKEDLLELWHRIVFNICVSNTDDHLRNHGFLLNNDTWELSPAYDINPNPDSDWMQLAVDFNSTAKDLHLALDTCSFYYLDKETALQEIKKIQDTVAKNWQVFADRYNIPKAEQNRMKAAFAQADTVLTVKEDKEVVVEKESTKETSKIKYHAENSPKFQLRGMNRHKN